ncbi:hypothetical protein CMUS01_02086 [Colletotrichum musicola]|uniref:Uncharacterized protein n=1 Tax=Colletotrichum musicola TaxID=2175873 RepID=A0A8H6NVV5_9PEZI|nr:hypothetical protein CMUS01_02086 [Colletotrichum musicola]
MGTDDAEVASRLGSPSPANHRSPIASPSCPVRVLPFPSPSVSLTHTTPRTRTRSPPPPDRRAFSASSPFARFIYPPVWTLASFHQPLCLSLSGCLLPDSLSHSYSHTFSPHLSNNYDHHLHHRFPALFCRTLTLDTQEASRRLTPSTRFGLCNGASLPVLLSLLSRLILGHLCFSLFVLFCKAVLAARLPLTNFFPIYLF